MSDTRQAPFEGSFRVTALHPRPKAARFYGEFDKKQETTSMICSRLFFRLTIVSMALLSAACSPDRMIGNQLRNFTIEHALPVILKFDDITVICHANDGMAPLVMSFTQFGVETDLMLAFGLAGSSICLENTAVEKELWSTMAERQGWANVAMDARLGQQILNRDAGLRQIRAYDHTTAYFKKQYDYTFGEGQCPKLKQEVEELLLLVGATAALQALQNDVSSGRLINVDMAIPPKIVRAMSCLDNQKWWGFPKSVQAALTVILPETPEAELQGWKDLQTAAEEGDKAGMRLSHATYAVVASIKGRDDRLRDALKRFEALPKERLNKDYVLLDQLADLVMRHIADRFWMRFEGHRAPTENYSKFWDEKEQPSATLDATMLDTM